MNHLHSVSRVRFACYEVDFSQREIRKHGVRVRLQHKPFQILELLLRSPGSLVTREEMARHLWPDSHVSFEHSLNTAVNSLRQALGDSLSGSRFIETRAGLGYAFIAPVERLPEAKTRPATHHDCLKGRYLLDKMTEPDTAKAIAYFESALLDDPRSALACSGLADAWCEFARLSIAPGSTAAPKASEYAVRALSQDSQLAEAHLALARVKMLFDWDWKAARSEFQRALEINPACAAAHRGYASLLRLLNEYPAALDHIRMARDLEPLSLPTGVEHAWLAYLSRDFNAAAEHCWTLLALEPRFWPAQLVLGLAYHDLGMSDESLAELDNAVTCSNRHPIALAALACLQPARASDVTHELRHQSVSRYVPPVVHALIHQSESDLNLAFDQRDTNLLWLHQSSLLQPRLTDAHWRRLRLSPLRAAAAR